MANYTIRSAPYGWAIPIPPDGYKYINIDIDNLRITIPMYYSILIQVLKKKEMENLLSLMLHLVFLPENFI